MKLFVTLIIAFLSFNLNAQLIVPKAGITFTTFELENSSGLSSGIGFMAGVGYQIGISELFSIQPELNFLQKSYRDKSNYDEFLYGGGYLEIRSEGRSKLNYLQIPVMFKFTFGNSTKFYLNAGPSIGFGINGSRSSEVYVYQEDSFGDSFEYSEENDTNLYFKEAPDGYEGPDGYIDNRLNFSLQMGGGITLKEKVSVDVRYGIGLTDLDDDFGSKLRVLQLTLGVPLKL